MYDNVERDHDDVDDEEEDSVADDDMDDDDDDDDDDGDDDVEDEDDNAKMKWILIVWRMVMLRRGKMMMLRMGMLRGRMKSMIMLREMRWRTTMLLKMRRRMVMSRMMMSKGKKMMMLRRRRKVMMLKRRTYPKTATHLWCEHVQSKSPRQLPQVFCANQRNRNCEPARQNTRAILCRN
jgi:hypothetical protein